MITVEVRHNERYVTLGKVSKFLERRKISPLM